MLFRDETRVGRVRLEMIFMSVNCGHFGFLFRNYRCFYFKYLNYMTEIQKYNEILEINL